MQRRGGREGWKSSRKRMQKERRRMKEEEEEEEGNANGQEGGVGQRSSVLAYKSDEC